MISKDRGLIAMIVAVFISGVGHMIVGYIKRGIIILVIAIVIGIPSFVLLGPFGFLVVLGFWLWQLYDLYKLIKKDSAPKDNFNQGWETKP